VLRLLFLYCAAYRLSLIAYRLSLIAYPALQFLNHSPASSFRSLQFFAEFRVYLLIFLPERQKISLLNYMIYIDKLNNCRFMEKNCQKFLKSLRMPPIPQLSQIAVWRKLRVSA
jgi:hypothetical protein